MSTLSQALSCAEKESLLGVWKSRSGNLRILKMRLSLLTCSLISGCLEVCRDLQIQIQTLRQRCFMFPPVQSDARQQVGRASRWTWPVPPPRGEDGARVRPAQDPALPRARSPETCTLPFHRAHRPRPDCCLCINLWLLMGVIFAGCAFRRDDRCGRFPTEFWQLNFKVGWIPEMPRIMES